MPLPLYRVTLCLPAEGAVPDGAAADVARWLNAQLGKDTVPDDLGPAYSATGSAPGSHHAASTNWHEEDANSMLGHLADLGKVERPSRPTWDAWTLDERCAWVNETLYPALQGNAGGGVLMERGDGAFNPAWLMEDMGLVPVGG